VSDILIVGGGVAGLSAAAALAPLGDVVLLEAEAQLGYHATGRSAAMFLRDYGNDVVRALNYASNDYLEGAGLLTPRAMMLLARADQKRAFMDEYPGFNMETISVAQAQQKFPILNPDTVGFVGYREGIFDLDTDLMVQGFVKRAKAQGARIITSARVEKIEKGAQAWRVTAGGCIYDARLLVNAAGAWADTVAQMAGVAPLGIQPYRRSFAQLAAPQGHDTSDDAHRPDFIWCAGQGGYGFQTAPAASALLADLIADRAPALDPATVAALSPSRFG